MPNLSINNVPPELAEALRQRAARNHRSLQGELMVILQQAVESDQPALQANTPPNGCRRGTRTLEDLAQERRLQFPQPVRGGPLAVDLIRADRDQR
ncbi:MAG TPA: Arc family DNA-binding protein [Ramlibacter sp.]|nr:Arc family DNA-binding protein [Ramlibacter sp.]